MANSSEKKAAWGAYMALWKTSPTVTASTSDPKEPVSTIPKKTNAHTPTPTAPTRYTGLRPTRSDSAPNTGISANWTAEAIRTAFRAVCLGKCTCETAYASTKVVIT